MIMVNQQMILQYPVERGMIVISEGQATSYIRESEVIRL
jgi:hypothetical protein